LIGCLIPVENIWFLVGDGGDQDHYIQDYLDHCFYFQLVHIEFGKVTKVRQGKSRSTNSIVLQGKKISLCSENWHSNRKPFFVVVELQQFKFLIYSKRIYQIISTFKIRFFNIHCHYISKQKSCLLEDLL